jgi:hypothetical protein
VIQPVLFLPFLNCAPTYIVNGSHEIDELWYAYIQNVGNNSIVCIIYSLTDITLIECAAVGENWKERSNAEKIGKVRFHMS